MIGLACISLSIMLLSGCGKHPKKEMIEAYQEMTKSNAVSFKITVPKFSMETTTEANEQAKAYSSIINTQLKAVKVTGETLKSGNKEQANMDIEFYGQKIPFEVKTTDKKGYLSLKSLQKVFDIATTFKPDLKNQVDTTSLKIISTKYLMLDLKNGATASKNSKKVAEIINSSMKSYVNQLDEKRFKEKDDIISITFTKSDMKKIVVDVSKKLSKEKNLGIEKISGREFDKDTKELKKFNLKVQYNKKKKVWTVYNDAKAEASQEGIFNYELKYVFTPKNSKNIEIKLPSKENSLTDSEATVLIEKIMSSPRLSDDDFNKLLEKVKENKASINEESKTSILKEYKAYLTEAQYNQLATALK